MKRLTKALLSLLLLLCLMSGLTAASAFAAEELSPDGSVLFEKDGLKVTSAGLDTDPTSSGAEPIIWVDIENEAAQDAFLGVAGGCVNGIMADVVLIDFFQEDGNYYGGEYDIQLNIPANSNKRYALGYYKKDIPGIHMDTLESLEFSFTLAQGEYVWPDYISAPVRITSGEHVDPVDISALGTVVLDNDTLTLVIGQQDYNDWMGPEVYVYAENKTDHFIGLSASSAKADGKTSEYVYYSPSLVPHKTDAGLMSFEGDLRETRGFEELTIYFSLHEAESLDGLGSVQSVPLEPVSAHFSPQIWGDYENGGLRLEIQPKYNDLLTVAAPADENGILFSVSETASLEAGGYEGAGWLFSIGRIDENRLHEMLCHDMSGVEIFAKDSIGNYYVNYHPTDVRYARATVEEMHQDSAQWSMLSAWASELPGRFAEKNGLEHVSFGNSAIDMYLARAAWNADTHATLSTTEYGPIDAKLVDGTPYVEYLQNAWFMEADAKDTPDSEYVVLNLPDEDARLDFFFAPGAYVRLVNADNEQLYQAGLYDEKISNAEVMQGWYYAAAEKAGLREPDTALNQYLGSWREKSDADSRLEISRSFAPGNLKIEISRPDSENQNSSFIAALDQDGRLSYRNEQGILIEYSAYGEGEIIDTSEDCWLTLEEDGLLRWHSSTGEERVYIR